MASTTPLPDLTTILCLLLFATFTSAAYSDYSYDYQPSFEQCFRNYSTKKAKDSPDMYVPKTRDYNATFISSVQNARFLPATSTKPSYIVVPKDASDVQAAVSCGRQNYLHIRVRSGGHDYEGMSYSSSGNRFVLLDLTKLRSIDVNVSDKTAWVGGGATVGEVYYNIGTKNDTLAFPAGICPTIGVGGHFSGGGIGAIMRKYGVSADNVIDALLVNANGELLDRASMGEDLFWAIRGGGGASFGVIVGYKIRLVDVPPKVTAFALPKNLKQGATMLVEKWQRVAPKFDDNLFVRILAQATADPDSSSTDDHTVQAIFQGLFLGECKPLVSMLKRDFPELGFKAEDCNEMSWLQAVLYFAGLPEPKSLLSRKRQEIAFKAKSDFVRTPISTKDWEGIWKFLMDSSDEPVTMIMDPWGGVLERIPEDAIAFPHRKGNLFNIQYFLGWSETDAPVTKGHMEWMRKFHNFMAPYVSSKPRAAYLNYKDGDLGVNEHPHAMTSYLEAAVWGMRYFRNNYWKLTRVKARVDRLNYFQNEQTIPPYVMLDDY